MITAVNNKSVKRIAALKKNARNRREENSFIAEGLRMFEETPDELIKAIYVTHDFLENSGEKKRLERLGAMEVSEEVFLKLSDTVTPQGVLMEVGFVENNLDEMISGENALILCLQDIQDPGNLGTMVRTAEGAGVSGIILSKGCVDIYSPKVVRSTMGAIYRMPFVCVSDFEETMMLLKKKNVKLYAAALRKDSLYTNQDFSRKCAILIGNEGNGLSEAVIDISDEAVTIPMEGQVESLNAAVSAAILMYEAKRQRDSVIC